MDSITEKIKRIREEKGISKAKMSEALDIDPSNYNRYEKNGKDWSITQIQKISDVLGISVIELLTGEAQKVGDSEREKELEKRVKELEETQKVYQDRIESMKAYALSKFYELAQVHFYLKFAGEHYDDEKDLKIPEFTFSNIHEVTKESSFWDFFTASTILIQLGLIDDKQIKKHYKETAPHVMTSKELIEKLRAKILDRSILSPRGEDFSDDFK